MQVLLMALMLVPGTGLPAWAQSYVGVSVAGHVPLTFDKIQITHPKIGYGGEAGFVYEWHREHFILHTGIRYAVLCPELSLDDQDLEQDMVDTRGAVFTYRGALRNRTDRMMTGRLAIPLYIGGIWHNFYAMAGAGLSIHLHTNATQKAQLKTVGDYQGRYYDWLEDMPNHGYHDYEPVKSSHAMPLSLLNVSVGAELGYAFQLSSSYRRTDILRVGLFAQYGLMDIRSRQLKESASARTEPDYAQYMNVTMNHIYAAAEAGKTAAHLFTCGIRLTLLFPVSDAPQHKHYPCRCYGNW